MPDNKHVKRFNSASLLKVNVNSMRARFGASKSLPTTNEHQRSPVRVAGSYSATNRQTHGQRNVASNRQQHARATPVTLLAGQPVSHGVVATVSKPRRQQLPRKRSALSRSIENLRVSAVLGAGKSDVVRKNDKILKDSKRLSRRRSTAELVRSVNDVAAHAFLRATAGTTSRTLSSNNPTYGQRKQRAARPKRSGGASRRVPRGTASKARPVTTSKSRQQQQQQQQLARRTAESQKQNQTQVRQTNVAGKRTTTKVQRRAMARPSVPRQSASSRSRHEPRSVPVVAVQIKCRHGMGCQIPTCCANKAGVPARLGPTPRSNSGHSSNTSTGSNNNHRSNTSTRSNTHGSNASHRSRSTSNRSSRSASRWASRRPGVDSGPVQAYEGFEAYARNCLGATTDPRWRRTRGSTNYSDVELKREASLVDDAIAEDDDSVYTLSDNELDDGW
jgi:hypothetical protein